MSHARCISPALQNLMDTLVYALDMSTCEVLDSCSEPLAAVRAAQRENKQQLQQEMDHWCRYTFTNIKLRLSVPCPVYV